MCWCREVRHSTAIPETKPHGQGWLLRCCCCSQTPPKARVLVGLKDLNQNKPTHFAAAYVVDNCKLNKGLGLSWFPSIQRTLRDPWARWPLRILHGDGIHHVSRGTWRKGRRRQQINRYFFCQFSCGFTIIGDMSLWIRNRICLGFLRFCRFWCLPFCKFWTGVRNRRRAFIHTSATCSSSRGVCWICRGVAATTNSLVWVDCAQDIFQCLNCLIP